MNHDVIVIGASAGGLEVLPGLAGALPADLRASLLVVLHLEERVGQARQSRPAQNSTTCSVRFGGRGSKTGCRTWRA